MMGAVIGRVCFSVLQY